MIDAHDICDGCAARVRLDATEIELVIYESYPENSFYAFECPECSEPVQRHAPQEIWGVLRQYGASCEVRARHLKLYPERYMPGPALTRKDEKNFRDLLQTDGWFDHLLDICEGDWNSS